MIRVFTGVGLGALAIVACLTLGSQLGCRGSGALHPEPEEAVDQVLAGAKGPVVAKVDGRPVFLEDFEQFWAIQSHLKRDEALQALVERELLFDLARWQAPLAGRDEVAYARKQAMVRVLLAEEVEAKVVASSIDEAQVEQLTAQLAAASARPAGMRASHLLVSVPREGQSKEAREHLFEGARTWAEQISEALPEVGELQDLYSAVDAFEPRLPPPYSLIVNAHLSFPVAGRTAGQLPDDWMPVVAEFAQGAAVLAERGVRGAISRPVRSDFGWHIIRFEEAFDAEEPDSAALTAQAREQVLQQARAEHLETLLRAWLEGSQVYLYPEVIARQGKLHE